MALDRAPLRGVRAGAQPLSAARDVETAILAAGVRHHLLTKPQAVGAPAGLLMRRPRRRPKIHPGPEQYPNGPVMSAAGSLDDWQTPAVTPPGAPSSGAVPFALPDGPLLTAASGGSAADRSNGAWRVASDRKGHINRRDKDIDQRASANNHAEAQVVGIGRIMATAGGSHSSDPLADNSDEPPLVDFDKLSIKQLRHMRRALKLLTGHKNAVRYAPKPPPPESIEGLRHLDFPSDPLEPEIHSC